MLRRALIPLTKPKSSLSLLSKRSHHPDPFDPKMTRGWKAALAEADIPRTKMMQEIEHNLKMGLPGTSQINDKTIPTFSRGELPHFAGINTFLKAPYIEDANQVGRYDAAVVGVPFDGGCTYRAGTRFGPQGIRRISALYTPYNYERGIDLREQMTLCDIGDVFTIPGACCVRTLLFYYRKCCCNYTLSQICVISCVFM